MEGRKNIFDLLESNFNIVNEFINIDSLLKNDNNQFGIIGSFYSNIDKHFISWKGRGSCLSSQDMKDKIKKSLSKPIDTNYIITFLEYYVNMFFIYTKYSYGSSPDSFDYCIEYIKNWSNTDKTLYGIMSNIQDLIERLHQTVVFIKEEERAILVLKDEKDIAIAEISNDNTALAIMQYHHRLLKGNTEYKKSLLIKIAHEYETILKGDYKDNFLKDYFNSTNVLLNNLNIRHNNSDADSKYFKGIFKNMKNDELENWYDDTYNLLLFCKLINHNSDIKNRVDKLCEKLKKKS